MLRRKKLLAAASALILALAGCGGDGGAGSGPPPSTPAPPAPPPSPPPPSPPPPAPAAPIGLTQLQDFPTYAWAYRYTSNMDGSNPQGPAAPDPTETVDFSYFATDDHYELGIPTLARGRLQPRQTSSRFTELSLSTAPTAGFTVSLYKPGIANPEMVLFYTSIGVWGDPVLSNQPGTIARNEGCFVYGIPTAAGDVPASGRFAYAGVGHGMTSVGGTPNALSDPAPALGNVHITFDLAAGLIGGTLDLCLLGGIGGTCLEGYDLYQFVYSPDRTHFSGRLSGRTSGSEGTFEGRFTGPGASEMMVRWQMRIIHPETRQPGTVFGVWAARRG